MYHPPSFVEKVTDRNGDVLFQGPPKGNRAFSVQTARVAQQVMQQVVTRGTGTAARLPGRQVAGKTGTSQEWQNAWFVGFTPQLATAVWMGSPVGNVSMKGVGGRNVTGGSFPAQIWGGYMREALEGVEAEDFIEPADKPKAGKYLRDKGSSDDRQRTRSRTRTTSATTAPAAPVASEGVQPSPGAPAPTAAPSPAPTAAPVAPAATVAPAAATSP